MRHGGFSHGKTAGSLARSGSLPFATSFSLCSAVICAEEPSPGSPGTDHAPNKSPAKASNPGHRLMLSSSARTRRVPAREQPMQYRPSPLDGFLAKTGLDLTLP